MVSSDFFCSVGFFAWVGVAASRDFLCWVELAAGSTDFFCWVGVAAFVVAIAVVLRACPPLRGGGAGVAIGFLDISDFARAGGRPGWSFCPWVFLGGGVGFTGTLTAAVVFCGVAVIGGVLVRVSFGASSVFASGLVSVTWVASLLPTREVLDPPR